MQDMPRDVEDLGRSSTKLHDSWHLQHANMSDSGEFSGSPEAGALMMHVVVVRGCEVAVSVHSQGYFWQHFAS